jgi:hypothetical protein
MRAVRDAKSHRAADDVTVSGDDAIPNGDVLARPIDAFERGEVLVERHRRALLNNDFDEAQRILDRLHMLTEAGAAVLAGRRERLEEAS